jgi:hypothetical protein
VLSIVGGLVFGRRAIAAGGVNPTMIKPVDVLQGGQLQLVEAAPRPVPLYQLGLVQAVHRLGERVVIRIPFATNGNRSTGLVETFGMTNR